MPFIIGAVSPEEKAELQRRGWKIESPPPGMLTPSGGGDELIQIFVDANLIDMMSGPDWAHEPEAPEDEEMVEIELHLIAKTRRTLTIRETVKRSYAENPNWLDGRAAVLYRDANLTEFVEDNEYCERGHCWGEVVKPEEPVKQG